MNPNESWIAEQARLLTLEDGVGPSYMTTGSRGTGIADVSDEAEAAAS